MHTTPFLNLWWRYFLCTSHLQFRLHCLCFRCKWYGINHSTRSILIMYFILMWLLLLFKSYWFSIQTSSNPDPIVLLGLTIVTIGIFGGIFMCCELPQILTIQYDNFDNQLCQCKWYLLPIEVRRMLLIFMSSTQQPAIFYGYADIECSRETFKMVNFYLFWWIVFDLVIFCC